MSRVIKVENLSKAYRLGEISTGTLSHDLHSWWSKVRGKEDPFLKIGEVNDRTVKGTSNIVWSLKDINFDIEQGDAVGIIGRNGAGKSTLLKIISRITAPTTGTINAHGRIASLLEVGTGFHPELTGRENVFLNGAILGMRKHEISRKFDEIVEFSGVERYIDTPVKRYSSGMYVRLAFAVAAYLESEILIVDEVLAVGDSEFQKKCLNKMQDVTKKEGRTVLFVSHNLTAVANLCKTGLFMVNGNLLMNDNIKKVMDLYDNYVYQLKAKDVANKYLKQVSVTKFAQHDNEEGIGSIVTLNIEIEQYDYPQVGCDIIIKYKDNALFFASSVYYSDLICSKGKSKLSCKIGPLNLAIGTYTIDINVCRPMERWIEENPACCEFDINNQISTNYNFELSAARSLGYIVPGQKWSKI